MTVAELRPVTANPARQVLLDFGSGSAVDKAQARCLGLDGRRESLDQPS